MTDEPAPADEPADSTDNGPDDADPSTPADGRHRSRRQRLFVLAGLTVFAVAIVGIVWVLITALAARSRLNDVRAKLGDLRTAVAAGQAARADQLVHDIAANAQRAHSLTSGPAWWVASNLPAIGSPAKTTRVIALQADRLGTRVLPAVSRLTDDFQTGPSGSDTHGSSVPLDRIAAAAPLLHTADKATRDALEAVRDAPASWLSPVSNGRRDVLTQLGSISDELSGADRAVGILLPMLGEDRPQRYFVGFLNEAEARGAGGLPGAFAIVTADHGRIRFEHFGADNELEHVRAKVDLGSEFAARYRNADPTGSIQNSDISPDFSYAARIWAGMWQAKTGEHVDGALAVDPTALSYLLSVTGPAPLPGGGEVSADNVVELTQITQYTKFPEPTPAENQKRKQYLIRIAQAVATKLTSSRDARGLARAVSRAATERRVVVWSGQAGLENMLRDVGWAGALGTKDGAAYSGFVVNNSAGTKLDVYLHRTMTYSRANCRAGGSATAALTLVNEAPQHGLPPYVVGRADNPPTGARAGDTSVLLTYYASRKARIVAVKVDGKEQTVVPQPEGAAQAVTIPLELRAGSPRRIEVEVAEPAASGKVDVLQQPLVQPLRVDLSKDQCP